MKKNRLLAFLLLFALLACSCGVQQGLTVYSDEYDISHVLQAAELDVEAADFWYIENPYSDCSCSLELKDGDIWIHNEKRDNQKWFLPMSCGYIVGINWGGYDGWVQYYKTGSGVSDTPPTKISSGNCISCLEINRHEWLILTDNLYATDGFWGKMLLCSDNQDGVQVEELCRFDQSPQFLFQLESGDYLIFTDKTVFSFSFETRTLEEMVVSRKVSSEYSLLDYMDINSGVQVGNMIYCGTTMGIYSVDISSGTEHFYPLDYASCVK